jgi:putative ABC transport system permease protein
MFPRRRWRGPAFAWRNLVQTPGYLGLAIAAISLAVMLLFMQLAILGALINGATLLYDQLNFDIVLISQKSLEVSFTQPFSRQRLYQVNGIEGVTSTHPVYLSFGDWQNAETKLPQSLLVLGFNLEEKVFKDTEIVQQIGILQQQDTVLMNRLSASGFGPKTVGTITELINRKIKIGGLFAMNNSFRFDGAVIVSAQNFIRLYPQRSLEDISLGLVTVEPNADIRTVIHRIRHIVPGTIQVLSRREAEIKDQYYWLTSTSTGIIVGFGVFTAILIGAVIVYQILNADVMERLPEYATLKAIGYSNRRLAIIVLQQATILAVLGFVLGLIFALGLYEVMHSNTYLPIKMPASRVLLVFILTLLMCNISALISLQPVIKLDPSDIF